MPHYANSLVRSIDESNLSLLDELSAIGAEGGSNPSRRHHLHTGSLARRSADVDGLPTPTSFPAPQWAQAHQPLIGVHGRVGSKEDGPRMRD